MLSTRAWRSAAVLAVLAFSAAGGSTAITPAEAASCCGGAAVRPQDEIWLIDSRRTSHAAVAPGRMPYFQIARFDGKAGWQASDMKSLLAGAEKLPHVFWVHGNRIEAGEARTEGLQTYRALAAQAPADQPIRFVIWSWPSGQVRGPLKDARLKAARSEPAGYQLAWVLDRLPAKTQVGLVGFSFGTRIVTGSLQLLGGGGLASYYLLERKHPQRPPVRVVSWAAAIHDDWLLPGHYHGQALAQTEQLLLLNNSCDQALRYYRFLDKRTRPEALGYVGLAPHQLGTEGAKITQCDLCTRIGPVHTSQNYINNPTVIAQTWSALMGPLPAVLAKGAPQQKKGGAAPKGASQAAAKVPAPAREARAKSEVRGRNARPRPARS